MDDHVTSSLWECLGSWTCCQNWLRALTPQNPGSGGRVKVSHGLDLPLMLLTCAWTWEGVSVGRGWMHVTSPLLSRAVLMTGSFLNSLRCVVPGDFGNLRGGREVASGSGVMDTRRGGAILADCLAPFPKVFRNSMCCWRRAIEAHPSKIIRRRQDGCFVSLPRLPDPK